jgi:hypothetical protein
MRLRDIFLLAQPPLLTKEGITLVLDSFIDSFTLLKLRVASAIDDTHSPAPREPVIS